MIHRKLYLLNKITKRVQYMMWLISIYQGKWRDVAISGNQLSIPKVNRWHTGRYVCLANNGIVPPINQTTDVEVTCK